MTRFHSDNQLAGLRAVNKVASGADITPSDDIGCDPDGGSESCSISDEPRK
jgi:hypothetical protein